jgi:nucleoside-diphosphate-sugar epimerase
MITGNASAKTIRAINVEGTLNAFRAARDAGAERFVYASSVAAYGFHADSPVGIDEDWPTRAAARLFYAQEKAELEQLLRAEASSVARPALYPVAPPIVLGPHALGAKGAVPPPVAAAGRAMLDLLGRLPVPVPTLVPNVQLQFIHEQDVGQALLRCVLAEGPPGAYNIAGDGVMPPATEWVEAVSHPAIMDTSKAKRELGWRPKYTGPDALRSTLDPGRDGKDGREPVT